MRRTVRTWDEHLPAEHARREHPRCPAAISSVMYVGAGLALSFQPRAKIAIRAGRLPSVTWVWREGISVVSAVCKNTQGEDAPDEDPPPSNTRCRRKPDPVQAIGFMARSKNRAQKQGKETK